MESKKFKDIKKAGLVGIIGNIFLLIIKGAIGIFTHSQSMIADSVNSASDIIASLMTFIGNRISSEPKDNDHNFGHGKAEYIFSLFISITMILVSIKLLADSVISLINKSYFEFSWILIIVCILTIITKLSLFLYTKNMFKKYDSILLKSNYKDHKNDCLVTTCTLISIVFGYFGIYWVDGLVGICISIWILLTGIGIFIESYNVLMDVSLDESTKEIIINLVKQHENIKNCYNLYCAPVGYKYLVVFTIAVDGEMSTYESHKLANHLEKDVEQLEKIDKAVVHVHPVNMDYDKK
ncbi:MAG: cation transporter [Clostridia bacterium]|nr:cation transporter [Clostridia bacterium]